MRKTSNLSTTTIRDVAEVSGFSAMTVTRCFGKGYISDKARKKIEAVAQELGYVPNQLAQTLRHGKSNVIAGLWQLGMTSITDFTSLWLGECIADEGYVPWVSNTLCQWVQVRASLRNFLSQKVAGLIFQATTTLLEDNEIQCLLNNFPSVVLIVPEEVDLPYDQLIHRRGPAVEQIVDYLTGKGRRRLCFLTTPNNNRHKAFINKVSENPDVAYHEIIEPHYVIPNMGEGTCQALLEKYPDSIPFDALIAIHDEGALALISMLKKRGIKVPEDIAVVGWNDSDFSRYADPPLATVYRNSQKMVAKAVSMLIARMKKAGSAKAIRNIDMKFIPRESAG